MVKINVKQRPLWERLMDETTPGGKAFSEHYRKLNKSLGGALGRLAEQPQDIQGRTSEITMLNAIMERPKTPIGLLLGQAGVGKALPDTTPIPVADSRHYVPIGQLRPGDRVFNRKARPVEVLGVYPQGKRATVLVTFADGSWIRCDREHLWLVRMPGDRDYTVQRTCDIMEQCHFGYRTYTTQENECPVVPTPALIQPMKPNAPLGVSAYRAGKEWLTFHVKSVVFREGDSEADDGLPRAAWQWSIRNRALFLKGLIDDSGVTKGTTATPLIVQVHSERVAGSVASLAHTLGLDTTIQLQPTMSFLARHPVYAVTIHISREELDDLIDGNDPGDTYETLTDDPGIAIVAMTEAREEPCTCITVDDEEELFQAGIDHVVTHNTALVEQFAKDVNAGRVESTIGRKYIVLSLRVGTLAALGAEVLQTRLSTLLDDVHALETTAQQALGDNKVRIIVFIDEVHMLVTIFGPGTKIGGDVMKDVLARSPVRVIAATTKREYDSTIAVDQPLAERFKQVEIQELAPDIVVAIAQNWWERVAPVVAREDSCQVAELPAPDDDLLKLIIEANAMYRSDSAEPRKTLDIMEDLMSHVRRTHTKPTRDLVDDIFRRRYSISLSFKVSADDIYAEIERRIKGQPHALHVLKRLFRTMVFQLDPTSNKPMTTALFTGPTGVGKSETVKAVAHAMYPGQPVILNMNMPDFKTVDYEPTFRKKLGEFVRHVPNAVILFDELEKAHESILDSLLAILDEGIVNYEVTNREGGTEIASVSLRNTVVFATTNAGDEVFANDARNSSREARGTDDLSDIGEAEIDQLMNDLMGNLKVNGFKDELLGRFQRIVPYRSLSSDTILEITDIELDKLYHKLGTLRNIHIQGDSPKWWSRDYPFVASDVALYIAFIKTKATDSSAGGARKVKREIATTVVDSIIDAVYEHPNCDTFHIGVSHDTRIYSPGAANTEGGIVVTPIIDGAM